MVIIREHDSTGELMNKYLDFVHRYYDSLLLKEMHWVPNYGTYYQSLEEWKEEFKKYNFESVKTQ